MTTNTTNANTVKTPESLTWNALLVRYPQATVKVEGRMVEVDALKDAIEDGTLLGEVQAAAAEQGVETYDILRRMSRLLSSNLVNIRKRYDSPSKTKDLARCEMLRAFVKANMDAHNSSKTVDGGKAKWKYTVEEIAAIDLTEVKLLKSIRDCMASKLCKYPDDLPDGFQQTYAFACERYSEAKKAEKQGPAVTLDENTIALVSKLKEGGKLTKSDKAALASILEQLSK